MNNDETIFTDGQVQNENPQYIVEKSTPEKPNNKNSNLGAKIAMGVVGGAALGTGATIFAAEIAKKSEEVEQAENPGNDTATDTTKESEATSATSAQTNLASLVDNNIDMAININDGMSFSQAFAAARSEVGAGGAFIWRGGIYGTYYKTEWDSMSAAEKAEWNSHFAWNKHSETSATTTATNVHQETHVHVEIDPDIHIDHSVYDDLSFANAFASARSEVGAGGVFVWHGKLYNTFYAEEWNGMSAAERADFNSHFTYGKQETGSADFNQLVIINGPIHIYNGDIYSEDYLGDFADIIIPEDLDYIDEADHIDIQPGDVDYLATENLTEPETDTDWNATSMAYTTEYDEKIEVVDGSTLEVEVVSVVHETETLDTTDYNNNEPDVALVEIDNSETFDNSSETHDYVGDITVEETSDILAENITTNDLGDGLNEGEVLYNNTNDLAYEDDASNDIYYDDCDLI